MCQKSLIFLTNNSCTLSLLPPSSSSLFLSSCVSPHPLPSLHSHAQSSALIGPCSRGCHSPANRLSGACSLSNPKEGVSQRATPWLLLANSGHLLRPPASEGKGQTRAARHSGGGCQGWRGEVGHAGGINKIRNHKRVVHYTTAYLTLTWDLKGVNVSVSQTPKSAFSLCTLIRSDPRRLQQTFCKVIILCGLILSDKECWYLYRLACSFINEINKSINKIS